MKEIDVEIAKPNALKHPWDLWISSALKLGSQKGLYLQKGKDFTCQTDSMANRIRTVLRERSLIGNVRETPGKGVTLVEVEKQ